MFRRGNPFVRAREETSSTCGASPLRAGLSLSWPSHVLEREHDRRVLVKNEYLFKKVSKGFSVVNEVHHGDTDFEAKTIRELRNKIVVCWEGLLCKECKLLCP